MMRKWDFHIVHRPEFWRRHDLFVGVSEFIPPTPDRGGRTDYSVSMVQKQITRADLVEPFASFDDLEQLREALQPMVNEAARFGILPTEGASEMKALRAHLEDMRALTFGRPKP